MKSAKLKISFIVMVTLAFFAVSNLFAQEKRVKEKDIPSTVTKAFHSEYPAAKIIGTSTEVEKGVTYFEIESMDGKVRRDLLYTKTGKVEEIEEVLTAATIPDFVKKSIEKKFKDVEYKKGEKNMRNSVTKYELIIEASELKYEVVCDAHGKITKTKKIKNEESEVNDND